MNTNSYSAPRLYNPDWLSDDELVAGFTARQEMLEFLCGELERAPIRGTTQHFLLIGVRGSGKTSLLKRIAVAIRRESRLSDHLIGLSFPEELYEVKGLSDLWWASCRALLDALDNGQTGEVADRLAKRVEEQEARGPARDPHDDTGLRLMLEVCKQIGKRPVLLVDNLDLVLKRIDKTGRKLKDRQSPAYWALREVLSTATAPVLIGGSVRLSAPFLGHDDAFYDYFIAQRLGKLSLEEVKEVFDHLARNHGGEPLRERMRKRPGRMRALYEMTGGNPRALGLVFELLRRGPNSSAVDAFEQLLDLTTPYYKARFEELPEQAQVVLHALALSRRDITKATYGHRAAVVAQRAGLDTRIASAQLEMLVNEGVVEKNKGVAGRTQYRVSEQLFRLWLQMRSTRRMRQQVISLTEFLEALFDQDEYQEIIRRETDESQSSSLRSRAKLSLALSELQKEESHRYDLETRAADFVLQAGAFDYTVIEGKFAPGDLSEGIEFEARRNLQRCAAWHKDLRKDAERLTRDLLGSLLMSREEKRAAIGRLCNKQTAEEEFARVEPVLAQERQELGSSFSDSEVNLLYTERASGRLHLPYVLPKDVEFATDTVRSLTWRLLCKGLITHESNEAAHAWILWGKRHFATAESSQWADLARVMRQQSHAPIAREALEIAFANGGCFEAWYQLGRLEQFQADWPAAELAFKKAIEINPTDSLTWSCLGRTLDQQGRHDETESAYRKATEFGATDGSRWIQLGDFLRSRVRYDEAETAYIKAADDRLQSERAWIRLSGLFVTRSQFESAVPPLQRAIEVAPRSPNSWVLYGMLLASLRRHEEAEHAFRRAIEIEPADAETWELLAVLLASQGRSEEAASAYRKAIEADPSLVSAFVGLGRLLADELGQLDEAAEIFSKALQIDPEDRRAQALLELALSREIPDDVIAACRNGNWNQVRQGLAALVAAGQQSVHWLANTVFIRHIVRPALERGDGPRLLAILQEARLATAAGPLVLALGAAIEGGEEKLATVEPEVRSAALLIFKWLTEGPR